MRSTELKGKIKKEVRECLSSVITECVLMRLKVLAVLYRCLKTGTPRNKRSIYYEGVSFFKSQARVDRLLGFYARKFECAEEDLGIKPSLKGLVSGNLVLYKALRDTESEADGQCSSELVPGKCILIEISGKSLIPDMTDIVAVLHSARTVLVIEKDSVFAMAEDPSIITVCGKGYPCRNTIALLRLLEKNARIICMTDFDPYGLHIFLTYRKAVPNIERLGLSAGDLFMHKADQSEFIHLNKYDMKIMERIRGMINNETKSAGLGRTPSNQVFRRLLEDLEFIEGLGYKLELDSILKQGDFDIKAYIDAHIT